MTEKQDEIDKLERRIAGLEKTLQIVSRKLMPPEDYVNTLNEMVQTFLESLKNN